MAKRKDNITWEMVYEQWQSLSVPEVEIIPFDIDIHHNHTAWFYKAQNRQQDQGNPAESTAHHLLNFLKDKPDSVKVAHKIHAFAISVRKLPVVIDILSEAYETAGETLSGWWFANAIHTLPDTDDFYDYIAEDKPSIETIVNLTAKKWTCIADEWALVRTPNYMDRDDPIYEAYRAKMNAEYEEREYQEYLRLKKKYG